jgi:hypothetical protein
MKRSLAVRTVLAGVLFAGWGDAYGSGDSAVLYFTWNIQGEVAADTASPEGERLRSEWERLAEAGRDSAVMIVDLGNTFYPGALSRFSYGSLMGELLNRTHVAVKAVGIKDFFQGRERLAVLRERAGYAFLSSNLIDKKTRRPLWDPVVTRSPGGICVRIVSALSPKEAAASKPLSLDGVKIADPVSCLKEHLATFPDRARPFTICLCDKQTLDEYPALQDLDGIDLFACGMPKFDPARSRSPRETLLANGRRILYVPPFSEGVGMLVLTAEEGMPARPAEFTIQRAAGVQPSSRQSPFFSDLVGKWTALYLKEKGAVVARMDEPLVKNQVAAVGNLLRERTGADLACLEASLITEARLAGSVTGRDLDRLITSSPDLLVWKLSGSDIGRARRVDGVQWVGIDAGSGVAGREMYSVVITENAFSLITEALGGGGGFPKPRYLFTSITEAVADQLSSRKSKTYDFNGLGRRWRRSGEASAEVSAQSMTVGNRRGIDGLSGVSYEPYSNWNINLKVPLSIHNAWHRFDVSTDIDYASSEASIERNFLELKLDYGFNPNFPINAYASADYQSFIVKEPGTDMPVRMRTTAGAMTEQGEWTFKLGFGAEKLLSSPRGDPFHPFGDIVTGRGGERWAPAFELTAQGGQSVSDLLRSCGLGIPMDRDIDADVSWRNLLSLARGGSRLETRLTLELAADVITNVKVKVGYDLYWARLLRDRVDFYNFNPSLSILGTYRFKW